MNYWPLLLRFGWSQFSVNGSHTARDWARYFTPVSETHSLTHSFPSKKNKGDSHE